LATQTPGAQQTDGSAAGDQYSAIVTRHEADS
jgi:hypothetical protein